MNSKKSEEIDITIRVIAQSQRKAARVAGFTFLIAMVIVIAANFGINFRLIVPGNSAETAKNILAQESLFRLGIIAHLIYCTAIIILLNALYIILKPVNQAVAMVAAFLRLIYALVWVYVALNYFTALRLIGNSDYLRVFEADRLQALARLYLSGSDAYYVGLLFWSLASTFCGWLWYKSDYIPGILALFGVISSIWCVFCTIAYLVFPNFGNIVGLWWFDSPLTFFETALGFWLLLKGLSLPRMAQPNLTNQEQL
jgi:hypothetical protein